MINCYHFTMTVQYILVCYIKVMASRQHSPDPRSARTSTSSTFLDEKEFMFLANRSEQNAPAAPLAPITPKPNRRPNVLLVLIGETYGAVVSDSITLFVDLVSSVWRWVHRLLVRSKTCVVSVVGLLGAII